MNLSSLRSHASETGLNIGSWLAIPMTSLKRAMSWIRCKRRMANTMRTLMALDDDILADIGLHRMDIEYLVRNGHLLELDGDERVTKQGQSNG